MATPTGFPLPEGYFSCPALSPDDVKRYKALGEAASIELVQRAKLHNGAIQWSLHADTKDVQIYCGHDSNAPSTTTTWCGITLVPSSLSEIAAAFQCSNTQQYREYCRRFTRDCLDAVNLYSIQPPTVAQPFCSANLRWHVQQSPVPSFVKHRDYVFLEHLSGYVFLECYDQPGHVRVASLWHLDPKGKVPKWIISNAIKQRCMALQTDLNLNFQKVRLLHSMPALLPLHAMIPLGHRLRCFACQKRFRPFSRKQNCRVCGEVVCRRCSQTWQTKELDVCLCVVCSMEMVKRPVVARRRPCGEHAGVYSNDATIGDNLSTMSSSHSDDVYTVPVLHHVHDEDVAAEITVEDFLNMISILEGHDGARRTSIDAMTVDDATESYVADTCRNDLIQLPWNWGDVDDITPRRMK
ncbi:hypothetical protein DYB32_008385 [Aphanomyces invadans]|uniref:FYVE-type domain-containing protein n=1 Tax=Aphanomyces invadans TaxID=157072 RepID=A0A418ALC4_9STRA|nr:hypothetical protein DYB32_008385 [Aphanomyces invadans]